MNSFTNWNDELCHSGKKGMKWGVRNYQNYDGSYTELGRIHYGIGHNRRTYQNDDGTLTELGKRRLYKSIVLVQRAANGFPSGEFRNPIVDGIYANRLKRYSKRIRSLISGHEYEREHDAQSKLDIAARNAKEKEDYLAESQNRKFNLHNYRKNLEEELKDKYNKSEKELLAAAKSERKRNIQKGKQIASELLGKYADKKVDKNWTASKYLDILYLRR